jgi:hypothetical protein
VRGATPQCVELRQRGGAARAVARDEDEPRPEPRQALGGDLSDAGGRSGDDDDFALNGRLAS